MIHVTCETCGEELEVPSSLVGQFETCPGCQRSVRVPMTNDHSGPDTGNRIALAESCQTLSEKLPHGEETQLSPPASGPSPTSVPREGGEPAAHGKATKTGNSDGCPPNGAFSTTPGAAATQVVPKDVPPRKRRGKRVVIASVAIVLAMLLTAIVIWAWRGSSDAATSGDPGLAGKSTLLKLMAYQHEDKAEKFMKLVLDGFAAAREQGAATATVCFSWKSSNRELDLVSGTFKNGDKVETLTGAMRWGVLAIPAGKADNDDALAKVATQGLTEAICPLAMNRKKITDLLGDPETVHAGRSMTITVGGEPSDSATTDDLLFYHDAILVVHVDGDSVQSIDIDLTRMALGGDRQASAGSLAPGRYTMTWYVSGLLMGTGRDDEVEVSDTNGVLSVKIADNKYYGGVTSTVVVRDGFVTFDGSFCSEKALMFRGRLWAGGSATGTLSGSARNLTNQLQAIDNGTFRMKGK